MSATFEPYFTLHELQAHLPFALPFLKLTLIAIKAQLPLWAILPDVQLPQGIEHRDQVYVFGAPAVGNWNGRNLTRRVDGKQPVLSRPDTAG